MNERGTPRVEAWTGEALEEALDRYEDALSERLNRDVTLKESFRADVKEAYGLGEEEADERSRRIAAEDRDRVACPHCAAAAERIEARGIDHDLDPSLTTRAYPVDREEDEDRADVLARAAETPEDLVADADPSGGGMDAADYRQLCEEGRIEGLMYRETGCDDHDGVYLAMVNEGEARVEDGVLRPRLVPA